MNLREDHVRCQAEVDVSSIMVPETNVHVGFGGCYGGALNEGFTCPNNPSFTTNHVACCIICDFLFKNNLHLTHGKLSHILDRDCTHI